MKPVDDEAWGREELEDDLDQVLGKVVGKSIQGISRERVEDEDVHEALVIVFTDGTRLLIRSQDFEDYRSWLRLKLL